jgi:D-glycero-alpha-D-manno-heptose 1-phosphate guanylyltransferase
VRLLVLSGGFGTRLKTTVADVPKALVPVGDVPFLQLQLEHWLAQGLFEFTFLLHHQADQIIAFLNSHQAGILKNCQIDWLIEPMPMDTGGAVAHAVRGMDLTGDFLIANADTWLGGGMQELIQATSPTIAVLQLADVSRYGQVLFDQDAHITSFSEKNSQSESGWINAGLCHLDAGLFKDWDGNPFSLERKLFVELVKNRSLRAIPLQTDFIDIGVPDDYHRFCRWVEAGRQIPLCN